MCDYHRQIFKKNNSLYKEKNMKMCLLKTYLWWKPKDFSFYDLYKYNEIQINLC